MNRECMICLEETSDFVTFSCKHEVCALCFPKVLQANPECPLCRTRLYVQNYEINGGICCAFLILSLFIIFVLVGLSYNV